MVSTFYVLTVWGVLMLPCEAKNNTTVTWTSAAYSPVMDVNSTVDQPTIPVVPKASEPANTSSTIDPDMSVSSNSTEAANTSSTIDPDMPVPSNSTEADFTEVSVHSSTVRSTAQSSTRNINPNPENTHTEHSYKSAYIIIFILLIICLAAAISCYLVQRKQRRFSLDAHGKNEDAQIPLSDVETEVFESQPPKDMQTFTTDEASSPTAGVETTDEEKGQSAAGQQAEGSTATAGQLADVALNDSEVTISNKTSTESLDEPPNANNSNNTAHVRVHGGRESLTEIILNDLIISSVVKSND